MFIFQQTYKSVVLYHISSTSLMFNSLLFQLDSILSPPSMPFRKSSNPEVCSGPGKSLKFKRQMSEDGRPFRRGSLGGALTGELQEKCHEGIDTRPYTLKKRGIICKK